MITIACSSLAAALKTVAVGAVLALSGTCPALSIHGVQARGVTIDASAVTFPSVAVYDSAGLTIKGGVCGPSDLACVTLLRDSDLTLNRVRCVSPGDACILISSSTRIEVAGGASEGSRGDGVDVAGSSFVHVHDFACSGNIVTPVHPDCVQGWNIAATASAPVRLLTDLEIDHNTAIGQTQGFDVFDAGAQRVSIHDNVAAITYANCVALLGGVDSHVVNNYCITYPGTKYEAFADVRGGSNVTVSGNTAGIKP